jgi:hypothetical protein
VTHLKHARQPLAPFAGEAHYAVDGLLRAKVKGLNRCDDVKCSILIGCWPERSFAAGSGRRCR